MICFIFRVYSQSHMMIPVTWHTWQKRTPSILLCMPRCLFLMECSFLWLLHRAWSSAHLVAIAGNWVTWWCLTLLVKTIPQTYILAPLCSQQDLRVVDYLKNCVMLKVASRNLWEGVSCLGNFISSLHSAADSLFKQVLVNLSIFCVEAAYWVVYSEILQIIFVHRKYFKKEDYNQLESVLFQHSRRFIEVCASSSDVIRKGLMYMSKG